MKFVPFTVIVNVASPAFLEEGEIDVVVGTGLLTVNVCAAEVPPPGAALKTVMLCVPAVAMSVAGMSAVTDVADTNVVVLFTPSKRATELELKLVPVKVIVN